MRTSESVTNMREYYAAPSFNEASRIERMESMRRKNEIKSVVELVFIYIAKLVKSHRIEM